MKNIERNNCGMPSAEELQFEAAAARAWNFRMEPEKISQEDRKVFDAMAGEVIMPQGQEVIISKGESR